MLTLLTFWLAATNQPMIYFVWKRCIFPDGCSLKQSAEPSGVSCIFSSVCHAGCVCVCGYNLWLKAEISANMNSRGEVEALR